MDATQALLYSALDPSVNTDETPQPAPQAATPAASAPVQPAADPTMALLKQALVQPVHPGWRSNGTKVEWYDPTGSYPTPESWKEQTQQPTQVLPSAQQADTASAGAAGSDPTMALLQQAQANPWSQQNAAPAGPQPWKLAPTALPQWAKDEGTVDPQTNGDLITAFEGPTFGMLGNMVGAGAALQHNFLPFITGKPTNFKKDYSDVSGAYRNAVQNYTHQDPTGAAVSQVIASIPTLGFGGIAEEAGNPGFWTNMGRTATVGGVTGGTAGFGNTDGDFQQRLGGAAKGAAMGTAFGAALTPVGYGASKAFQLGSALLRGSPAATVSPANAKAAKILLGTLDQDSITPATAAAQLRSDPTGQLTLADVGGENSFTQRLARHLVTDNTPASKQITSFLNNRDAGQSSRVLSTINSNLVNSPDALQLGDALQASKMEQAKPLYEAAGIPSNPDDNPSAPIHTNSNAIKALISKSTALQSVIKRTKSLPQFVDLDDASMPILDQVYKGIGDDAATAAKFGNGTEAFNLGNLRDRFLNHITGGDPDHPYQQALNAYSGGADSQNAMALGQKAFGQPASQVLRNIQGLKEGDKDFFRIGFGSTLQQKLNNAGDGRDAVKVIYGNSNIRDSIGHVFGDDAAGKFDQAMQSERLMDGTSNYVTGGSQTANKLADFAKPSAVKKLIGDSIAGGAGGLFLGGLHGAAIGAGLPIVNAGKDFLSASAKKTPLADPEIAAKLADFLTKSGKAGADAFEAVTTPIAAKNAANLARNQKLAALLTASAPVAGIGGAAVSKRMGN